MIIGAILGAVTPWLPDLFKWLGNKSEAKQELERIKLLDKLEADRDARKEKAQTADRETQKALLQLRGEISTGLAEIKDRKEARKYQEKVLSLLVQTLRVGKEMHNDGNLWWELIMGVSYMITITVEAFSATIQPLIAATIFGMWAYSKHKAGLGSPFDADDKEMLAAIVAFFFSNRTKKQTALNDVRRS